MPKISKVKTTFKKPVTESVGVVDRIKPLEVSGKIKINVYGQSATGKTRLWATFPKPILCVIASGGKKPGELRSIDTPEYRKTVHSVELQSDDELREIYDHQKSTGKYATVVLDHSSGLQDMVLRGVLGIEEIPEQKSWGMASRTEYGQCGLKMKELLRGFIDLSESSNVVIVSQEREFNTDEDDSDSDLIKPYVAASMQKGVVGWLNPAVDYIVQTFKRGKTVIREVKIKGKVIRKSERVPGVEYCLRTGPHEVYVTKFRVPRNVVLPEIIVDPTFEKINDVILGKNESSVGIKTR